MGNVNTSSKTFEYARDIKHAWQIPAQAVFKFEEKIYTVVATYPGFNEIALSLQKKKPIKPVLVKVGRAIYGEDWDNFIIEPNAFHARLVIEEASEAAYSIARARLNSILPIIGSREQNIESKLELYIRGTSIKYDISRCAEESGVSVQSIYNRLNLYLAFGSHVTALFPNYYVCGTYRELPKDLNAAIGKVIGNPSTSFNIVRRPFTQEDQDRLEKYIDNDLKSEIDYSTTSLYSSFIHKYCRDKLSVDQQLVPQYFVSLSKNVTYSQFYHHFYKTVDPKLLSQYIKGVKQAHNDDARRLGTEQELSVGPSDVYEIDSTTLNIYVLTRVLDINQSVMKTKRLGRPSLYLVIDVFSGKIVGYCITFRHNAMAAKSALYNAFTDKVEHCARWGVEICQSDWSSQHVCYSIFSDRGTDFKDDVLTDSLLADLQLEGISYSPAYISRSRGTVEVSFDGIDNMSIQLLPGRVKKKPAKDDLHPSTISEVTIEQLHRLVINAILVINRSKVNYTRLHGEDIFRGVSATPNGLWHAHIDRRMGGGIKKPKEQVRYALLNSASARVYKDYILLETATYKLKYRTDNKSIIQRQDRLKGKKSFFEIKIRFNSDYLRYAWYSDPKQDFKIIEFTIAAEDKRFAELIEIEAQQRFQLETALSSESRQSREQEHTHIAGIVDDINKENKAAGDKAKGKKSMQSGIKENTDAEAKAEIVAEIQETRKQFGFGQTKSDLGEMGEGDAGE